MAVNDIFATAFGNAISTTSSLRRSRRLRLHRLCLTKAGAGVAVTATECPLQESPLLKNDRRQSDVRIA